MAALVGLVVTLGSDDDTAGGEVVVAGDPEPDDTTKSTATTSSTGTSSTTSPLTMAIAVTSEIEGSTIGHPAHWIVPDGSVDTASAMLHDDPLGFDLLARERGWPATSISADEPLAVSSIIQGTPRLANENLSVAVTGFRIEVLEATAPAASGAVGGRERLPLTDDFRIDAAVLLPSTADLPAIVDLQIDGQSVESLEPFSLSATDNLYLRVAVDTSRCTCTWQGELDVLIAGERHTYPIVDESGDPFTTSGRANVTGVVEPAPPES